MTNMTNFIEILRQNGIDNSILQETKCQKIDSDEDYSLVGVNGKGKLNVVYLNVHTKCKKNITQEHVN